MEVKRANPIYVLVVGCHTGAKLDGLDYEQNDKYNELKKRELEKNLQDRLGNQLGGVNVYDLEDVNSVPGDLRNNPMDWLKGALSDIKATFLWEQDGCSHGIQEYYDNHTLPHIDLLVAVERQDYCKQGRCKGKDLQPDFTKGVIGFAVEEGIPYVSVVDYGVGTIEAAIRNYIDNV